MRLNWLGPLDWRLLVGVLSAMGLVAGLVWYGGYRPGISTTSLFVAGIVAAAALVAVLLSMSRSLWNLLGYVGLVGIFGALFVRSQLRRGAFAPPVEEWTIAVGLVGGLIAVAAMVRRSRNSHDAVPRASAVFSTVLTVFVLGAACLCLPLAKFVGADSADGESGLLRSAPIRAEVLPLPADAELVPAESFKVGGEEQHVFVINSTVPTTRAELVQRIVAHYLLQDWPLEPRQIGRRNVFYGCRPVRGLVTWNQRCMEIIVDEGTDDRPGFPAIPGAVNVYLR